MKSVQVNLHTSFLDAIKFVYGEKTYTSALAAYIHEPVSFDAHTQGLDLGGIGSFEELCSYVDLDRRGVAYDKKTVIATFQLYKQVVSSTRATYDFEKHYDGGDVFPAPSSFPEFK
jgi:hypothetical protein